MVVGWLEGSLGRRVGSRVGGWRVHGVGGCVVGGWRVHGVGAYTHPPIRSYNVKIFNFMNTHPPTHLTYPKYHFVTIHLLWMVHGWVADGGGVIGGFMGWVGEWWGGWRVHRVGGWVVVGWWLEGSWGEW